MQPKVILSLDNGAITLTELGGVFTLNFDEKASIGGGAAAGIVSVQGSGSIVLSGSTALKLLEAVINSHVKGIALPIVEGLEALANTLVSKA